MVRAGYFGAPEARVGELLAAIAAVEGLSAPVPPEEAPSIRRAE